MPSTPILGIPQVTPSQSQKETTINDAIVALEGALAGQFALDYTSVTTITLGATDFTRNFVYTASGLTAESTLKLPHLVNGSQAKRVIVVYNNSAYTLDVVSDSMSPGTSFPVPSHSTRLVAFFNDNVFDAAQAASTSNFKDLLDVPHAYGSQGGKFVTVKGDESGMEYTDAPQDSTPYVRKNHTWESLAPDVKAVVAACVLSGNGINVSVDGSGNTVISVSFDTDGTLSADSDTHAPSQRAVKAYVDAKLAGLSWKGEVRAASTANFAVSTLANGSTMDGLTLATGDRVLLKDQSSPSQNGIYVIGASGPATRATDANTGAGLVGASTYVSEGTANAGKQFVCSTPAPITVGTTSLTFVQFSAGGGGGGSLDVYEGGSLVVAAATEINFTGAGVTVSDMGGGVAEVAISGGGGGGGGGAGPIAGAVFNGAAGTTTVAFGGSLTRTYSPGGFTFTFDTPQPDNHYYFVGTDGRDFTAEPSETSNIIISVVERHTHYVRFITTYTNGARYNGEEGSFLIFPSSTAAGGGGGGGGSGGMTLLDSIVTTGGETTVSFASIPGTHKHLKVIASIGSVTNNGTTTDIVYAQFNGDTTGGHYGGTEFGTYGAGSAFGNASGMALCSCAGTSGVPFGDFEFKIPFYTDVRSRVCKSECSAVQGNVGALEANAAWWYTQAAAITDILFGLVGGVAFAAGCKFDLYAID